MTDLITVTAEQKALILSKVKSSYAKEAEKFLALAEERGGLSLDVMKEQVSSLDGKSAATINKHIAAMKATVRAAYSTAHLPPALQFQFEEAMKDAVPTVKINAGKKQIGEDKILTEEEYTLLREHATERIGLLMEFLWETATRVSEALSVRLDRCRPDGQGAMILPVIGKGNKEREVRISRDLFERITAYFRGTVYLFESSRTPGKKLDDRTVSTRIRKLGKDHLNRTIGPHTFRHSWATRMIKAGMTVKAVSDYLGHATTAITMDMYVHDKMSNEDLGIELHTAFVQCRGRRA